KDMTEGYVSLTHAQRLEISAKKNANPKLTNRELAEWAKQEFKLPKLPNITTISKLLKRNREDSDNYAFKWQKRQCKTPHSKMEEALALWIQTAEKNNIHTKWDMIKKA
ncbi:hypothetical protein DFQ30_005377, partial [Apophysomyces sp. BC1015]